VQKFIWAAYLLFIALLLALITIRTAHNILNISKKLTTRELFKSALNRYEKIIIALQVGVIIGILVLITMKFFKSGMFKKILIKDLELKISYFFVGISAFCFVIFLSAINRICGRVVEADRNAKNKPPLGIEDNLRFELKLWIRIWRYFAGLFRKSDAGTGTGTGTGTGSNSKNTKKALLGGGRQIKNKL
jgi:hypothetical protein